MKLSPEKKIAAINASLQNPKRDKNGNVHKPWVLQVPPINYFRFKIQDEASFFVTCVVKPAPLPHGEFEGLGASKRSMKDKLNRPFGRLLAMEQAVKDYMKSAKHYIKVQQSMSEVPTVSASTTNEAAREATENDDHGHSPMLLERAQ